jgi:hypothetical protein
MRKLDHTIKLYCYENMNTCVLSTNHTFASHGNNIFFKYFTRPFNYFIKFRPENYISIVTNTEHTLLQQVVHFTYASTR